MTISSGDDVTFEYVGRDPDGAVFDTSRESVADEADLNADDREYQPLTVEIGAGEIIPGLEEGLLGMEAGGEATIEVDPEDGYGHRTEEKLVEHEAAAFAELLDGQTPEEGMRLQRQSGEVGEVVHADEDVVRIDFNHPLAGETLAFDVEIVDVA